MHLTKREVVFEVYDATSIVQLSEMLEDLSIFRGERTIYSGRAVVKNLVSTGLVGIVSADLLDPWTEPPELAPHEGIQGETEAFVREWESAHDLRPSYELAVNNLRTFLQELSRWLSHAELIFGPGDSESSTEVQSDFAQEVQAALRDKIAVLFERFEEAAAEVPEEDVAVHKAFARRELHPLILCSPFANRAYSKPLGYAGDYGMVNMILGDPLHGPNTYARIVSSSYLGTPTAAAHRHRIEILTEYLMAEAKRMGEQGGRPLRVLNVGCGPAREVENFIREDPQSDRCSFDLVDFNEETVRFAEDRLREVTRQAGRTPEINVVHQSAHRLLRDAARKAHSVEPAYDVVYCAGLFDYLEDRICFRLLRLFCQRTYPGGLVLATNVHPCNPTRYVGEHLMEWYLIHRGEADLLGLAPLDGVSRVFADPTGVNVFLEVRKEVTPQ
jgi:extracellular factor (EF) 3-hydroxypalmitic acid methyl ester biosynthesis protein